ncbi:MAG TPA: polysaccharide deacetylase family protein [Chthonomonadaceae bacterium]|nr:polysaccharide deacetylase family protein [Chthonomonadaceae bacterium]
MADPAGLKSTEISPDAGDEPQHERSSEALEGHPRGTDSRADRSDEGADRDLSLPRPVFYDEERRRWPYFVSAAAVGMALLTLGLGGLLLSLFALRFMPHPALPKRNYDRDVGNLEPGLKAYQQLKQQFIQNKADKALNIPKLRAADALREAIRHDRRIRATDFERKAVAIFGPSALPPYAPVVAGFYVNWDQASYASAHRHIKSLSHFIPEWLHLKAAGANYTDPSPFNRPFIDDRNKQDREDVFPFVHSNNVPIIVLLNNFTRARGEQGAGGFDPAAVHQVVSNPKARANLIVQLRDWLVHEKMQGINIDFEQVPAEDRQNLVQFMKELYATLHPLNLLVTEDIELESDAIDAAALARYTDWIVPMFYDENEAGGPPGPVAGIDWTETSLRQLLKGVPANKLVMAIGNQAYDWTEGQPGAADLTYQSAIVDCKESLPDSVVTYDRKSLNPTFHYSETVVKNGKEVEQIHRVWMQDAVSVYNQLTVGRKAGIRGGALWFIGSEDPTLWSYFDISHWGANWQSIVRSGGLDDIAFSGQGDVTFEGEGELLQPLTRPDAGRRTVQLDAKSGLITNAAYATDPKTHQPLLPSAYVVRRYGGTNENAAKQIVLTFDDGPDAEWTPQILDILKREKVPACFFVVGQQALENPDLVKRMWREGHEIGNHSWSHPDLYKLAPEVQRLQLTSTQRLIEALTGHSTILFRPPYGGDVEPQTGRQVEPMEIASELGYVTVGELNDPQDWRLHDLKPGTEVEDPTRPRDYRDIVRSVEVNRNVGSVILLHDAGGDRSRTVAALPEIIHYLRANGYQFVSVAKLWGVPETQAMPPVGARTRLLIYGDQYVFETWYIVWKVLTTLFTASIFLGTSRVVLFVVLALIQRRKERKRVFPVVTDIPVSVVIAAYNEEKVINRTIEALLESDYPNLEVIVVDDGSKDGTSDAVLAAYGNHPKVRLLQKPNGGKASALNRGIMAAHGDVLVSLDADTLFAKDTVSRLVRHFVDPKVGAVSGNVRVGNAHNIWTRWQSLEYTTSQNFDRRGYDLLNCITVVPGAVGALRRSAVLAVGGYTSDTLAEDTDLTWKLRRARWRIVNDNTAMAYTEAPETLKNLAKQRFRWAFGTLQCLWKHQEAIGRHGAFGWLALPSLWLYQILFPAISPFMDLAMIASIFAGNFPLFFSYFAGFTALELAGATLALRMDRGDMRLLPWLVIQRFVYRQLMYYVILKSILAAIRGTAVGWNKLERTGTAQIEQKPAA